MLSKVSSNDGNVGNLLGTLASVKRQRSGGSLGLWLGDVLAILRIEVKVKPTDRRNLQHKNEVLP
jgi:hypothetical protein